jgi:cytochrome c biogenesis protein CcmG/thiol:disulfide interchange protein DsbE
MRRWCLAVVFMVASHGLAHAATSPRNAPRFSLPGVTAAVSSDSLLGKVVLVDFWASWCEPCRKSFPWMSDLYQRHAAEGFTIVAINLDKERDKADAFLEERPVPFLVAFDPEGKTAQAYRVSGMPSSFLLGRDGKIIETHIGFDPKKSAALEAKIVEACKR